MLGSLVSLLCLAASLAQGPPVLAEGLGWAGSPLGSPGGGNV